MSDQQPKPPEIRFISGLDLGKRKDWSALCVLKQTTTHEPLLEMEMTPAGPRVERTPMGLVTVRPGARHEPRPKTRTVRSYWMPALQRYDLGTDYHDIVDAVVASFSRPPLRGSMLAIDKTGVGEAVYEIFVRGFRQTLVTCYGCKGERFARGPERVAPCTTCKGQGKIKASVILRPIQITGGQTAKPIPDGSGWRVPKRELVSALDSLLSGKRLRIPDVLPMTNIGKDSREKVNATPLLVRELENFRVKINIETTNQSFEAWRERDHDDMVLATGMAAWVGEQGQQIFFMR